MVTFISPPTRAGQICFDKPFLTRVKFVNSEVVANTYDVGEIIYPAKCVVVKVFGPHDYLVCYRGIVAVKAKKTTPIFRGEVLIEDPDKKTQVCHDGTVKHMCGIAMSDLSIIKDKDYGLIAMYVDFAGGA